MIVKEDWTSSDFMTSDDMNRIEGNIEVVADYLRNIRYSIPSFTSKVTRTRDSVEFISDINRIENNIEIIRNNFLTPPDYLGNMSWDKQKTFDFTDANRLELNLKELLFYAENVYKSYRYCGTMNTGGGGLY